MDLENIPGSRVHEGDLACFIHLNDREGIQEWERGEPAQVLRFGLALGDVIQDDRELAFPQAVAVDLEIALIAFGILFKLDRFS